jgi:hypothetical protein
MEMTPEEKNLLATENEKEAGCGCSCHKLKGGMSGCSHCGGFGKGLVLGLILMALIACLCDHFHHHNWGTTYYNSTSTGQNMYPPSPTPGTGSTETPNP